jgi:hypothetical protein
MSARSESKAGVHQPRRQMIVDMGFQARFLLPILVYTVVFLVLTLAFVWFPMHRQIAADPSPIVQALLAAQLFRIELWLAPLLLLSGSLAALVALMHSQRIAGPIKMVREGLAKLAIGTPEPLTLRPSDEFRDLEAPFAGAVSRMEQFTRTNLEMLRLLRHNLEGLSHRAAEDRLSNTDLKESVAVLLRDVDAEIKKLQMKS